MLAFSLYITINAPRHYRLSTNAGFLAGLVAFTIYLVSSFSKAQIPAIGLDHTPAIHWTPILIGGLLGFTTPFLVHIEQLRPGLLGLLTLFLSATSSIAVFSYLYVSPLRDLFIFLALSAMLGMLLHVVLFSAKFHGLLSESE